MSSSSPADSPADTGIWQQATSDGLRAAVLALLLTSPEALTMAEIVGALVCRYRDQSIITEVENLDEECKITVLCARLRPGQPVVYTHFDRLTGFRNAGRLGEIREVKIVNLGGWKGWVSEL